jgi:hypothetical protein
MMFGQFTIEEINLICIFNKDNKETLLAELTAAAPGFDEPEMSELAKNVLARISKISDTDFDALELYPEYGNKEV